MAEYNCPFATDIGAIKQLTVKLDKTVNGNGTSNGLKIEVDRLKNNQVDMKDDLNKIATAMSGLAKAREEELIIQEQREKNREGKITAIKQVGTIAAIIFGLVATLAIILDHIKL